MFPWNLGTFKWLVSIALKLKPFQAMFVMTWRIQNCNTRLEMWTPVYFPTLENSEISDLFFSIKYFFCILHMALEKKNRILSNSTQLKMFPSIIEKPLVNNDIEAFLTKFAFRQRFVGQFLPQIWHLNSLSLRQP